MSPRPPTPIFFPIKSIQNTVCSWQALLASGALEQVKPRLKNCMHDKTLRLTTKDKQTSWFSFDGSQCLTSIWNSHLTRSVVRSINNSPDGLLPFDMHAIKLTLCFKNVLLLLTFTLVSVSIKVLDSSSETTDSMKPERGPCFYCVYTSCKCADGHFDCSGDQRSSTHRLLSCDYKMRVMSFYYGLITVHTRIDKIPSPH